jgi:hypothetical protein
MLKPLEVHIVPQATLPINLNGYLKTSALG